MKYRFLLTLLLILSLEQAARCQEQKEKEAHVTVRGSFHVDSLRIGDVIGYSLTARYPSNLNIIFPDSSSAFAPFEYDHKKYFATETENGESYDSVVYYISTFEIDSILSLAMPVYIQHPADCTMYTPALDSILLIPMVTDMPDSLSIQDLPLRETVAYEIVSKQFNYIIAAIVVGSILVIAAVVWWVFGKKIRRHYLIKRLKKNHFEFIIEYTNGLDRIKASVSPATAESAIAIWKKYMEKLEAKPYTKLTTKETIEFTHNDTLKENLQEIDKVVYGHHTAPLKPFESLKDFAELQFQHKLQEVQHG